MTMVSKAFRRGLGITFLLVSHQSTKVASDFGLTRYRLA
uniref:Uncharacterized protein n=1 Tax=Arundo donax TaxID=35708 RepID=A0A0A9CH52_ARUDO